MGQTPTTKLTNIFNSWTITLLFLILSTSYNNSVLLLTNDILINHYPYELKGKECFEHLPTHLKNTSCPLKHMSKIIHLTELMSTLYSSNRPKDQFSWLSRSSTSLMSSKSSSSSQALGEELPSLDTRGATELIVLLLCCFWGLGLGTSSLGEIHK